ncbi:hypothetical protein WJX74_004154 [Apatococcus lobatus]|uniref:Uncharacterized protein n=1 Tax=Apatococcus lobatus TaxID=904363 RepID=A0AAW1RH63_9CHLO
MAGCGGYYYSHRLGAAASPLATQPINSRGLAEPHTSIQPSATPGPARTSQQENPSGSQRAPGQFPWLPGPSLEQHNGAPAYRRHLAATPVPCARERPEGKKIVPGPRRTPAPPGGIRMFPAARTHEAGHLPEPDVGHMGRGEARASNAPSAKERSLEQSLHRKVRVSPGCYQGSGRAGDLSSIHQLPADYLEGFHPHKPDAPGFRRFVDSLAPSPKVTG